MRVGVLLPTFRDTPAPALAAAALAASSGLDGVFAYDHVWPMGSPQRPAIAPFEVLTAVAVANRSLRVGTLVARIGLVGDEVLLGQFRALRVVAGDRVVAALGTGDKLSKEENLAYGIDYPLPDERRASLRVVADTLHDEGFEVWIGAGQPATRAVATAVGCTLNLWQSPASEVAAAAAAGTVSWAGTMPARDGVANVDDTAALLVELAAAGSTWAVFGAPLAIETLALAKERAGPAAA